VKRDGVLASVPDDLSLVGAGQQSQERAHPRLPLKARRIEEEDGLPARGPDLNERKRTTLRSQLFALAVEDQIRRRGDRWDRQSNALFRIHEGVSYRHRRRA
jgi:hypothetical protein